MESKPEGAPVRALPSHIAECPPGWAKFVAKHSCTVLQCVLEDFPQVPGFIVVDRANLMLLPSAQLDAGVSYWIWIPNGASRPADLLPPLCALTASWLPSSTCLPALRRLERLQHQGTCLADDQISFALAFIAGCGSNIRVLEPLLLLKCQADKQVDPLRDFVPSMMRGCTTVTCLPLKGHWVSFAWSIFGGKN